MKNKNLTFTLNLNSRIVHIKFRCFPSALCFTDLDLAGSLSGDAPPTGNSNPSANKLNLVIASTQKTLFKESLR